MAATKKPSPAQLLARAKFTAMVRAKAAARKKAGNKLAAKKIGSSLTNKYFIEYFDQGIEQTKYYKSIPSNAVKHNGFYKIEIKGNLYPLFQLDNRQPVKIGGWFKGSTAFIEQNEKKPKNAKRVELVTRRKIIKPGTFKDFTKVSGLDKVVKKGNKTMVHYTKLSGVKAKPNVVKLAKLIATDTENNDHNNAVLRLSKYLKNKDAIYMMQAIISKHKSLGYMPEELQKARSYYLKELLNQAKYKLTGSNYEAILKSF
jgi:hypothetical protein